MQIHSNQTQPICLHSNQLKENWSFSSPRSYILYLWLTGCRHGPCPSPGPGQSKTCIRWGLMRLQNKVNERVQFSISKTKQNNIFLSYGHTMCNINIHHISKKSHGIMISSVDGIKLNLQHIRKIYQPQLPERC